ncbi:MAG: bifunctional riboflavin kinase/FAD synthetase [Clostridia bacterium]|nr:bifunctional riboflavin kinase/FAD synthetase [Clostridia bacterium]
MVKTALALGTFDGVHKGHFAVLKSAAEAKYKSVAVAFKFPPKMYIQNKNIAINNPKQKEALIKGLGINRVDFLNFKKVKNIEPEKFLKFLVKKYNPAVISCGFNYHFGKNGKGNIALLQEFCNDNNIILKVADPVLYKDRTVSSTYIRELLSCGNISRANELLRLPFGFTAKVIKGDKRGRTIGIPTINQNYPENLINVKRGVYKSKVLINEKEYFGVTNIGLRPTFATKKITAETHILNFNGNVYGQNVTIQLLEFIREEQKFSTINELKNKIENDIKNLTFN